MPLRIAAGIALLTMGITCGSVGTAAFVTPPPGVSAPFVGCESVGQLGVQPAPSASQFHPMSPWWEAGQVAYYRSADLGVLAPRGWHCIGLYGSSGSILLVTPEDHKADALTAKLIGPAVQVSYLFSDTSGRFEAARIAARLFPDRGAFVNRVIAEGIEPASAFPNGPYAGDTVFRRDNIVEFKTPGGQQGMGTQSRLQPADQPIFGMAIIDKDNNVTISQVRLPAHSDEQLARGLAYEGALRAH